MSRTVFNVLCIVICIVSIVTSSVILPYEYKRSVKKGGRIVQILGYVLSLAMILLTVSSLDWSGKPCISGQLQDVHIRGSFAGVYDRYAIVILTEDGKKYFFESIAPVYGKSMKHVESLSVGSSYDVYGSTMNHSFFYAIYPSSEQ